MAEPKTDEDYYRQDWMTDDQWECAELLADLQGGFHHVTGKIKRAGDGIETSSFNFRAATYDFDGLTRLVVLAHDRMIRAEIAPSGPGMLKLYLQKRHLREGGHMHERHPELEQAAAAIRSFYGADNP